ncbi:hypothetical protein KIN20_016362 [Parelaphostrongylus tenuis]|uniref:Uncharacterized protein n=1 Tax=Parelaphostrongylus tenuis TaxID=148309 RepID=A0AAD5MYG0_PARTN|nr:hypothetical protein KIN20_016362 [Parelaphostrongylus tenuis]
MLDEINDLMLDVLEQLERAAGLPGAVIAAILYQLGVQKLVVGKPVSSVRCVTKKDIKLDGS